MCVVVGVGEEILERGKQKRSELALLSIYPRVDFLFNQVSEKALRQVLRIVHGIAAAAHESVKRRPIGLAKLSERGSANLRVSLASSGGENHAPMGWGKGAALTVDGLSQSFHVTRVSESREKNKPRENYRFRAAPPAQSLCKGRTVITSTSTES